MLMLQSRSIVRTTTTNSTFVSRFVFIMANGQRHRNFDNMPAICCQGFRSRWVIFTWLTWKNVRIGDNLAWLIWGGSNPSTTENQFRNDFHCLQIWSIFLCLQNSWKKFSASCFRKPNWLRMSSIEKSVCGWISVTDTFHFNVKIY